MLGDIERRAPRQTQRCPAQGDSHYLEIYISQLHINSQSVEQLVDLEILVQHRGVSGEMPHGDPLLEHESIQHKDSQPQLEPMGFPDEVS